MQLDEKYKIYAELLKKYNGSTIYISGPITGIENLNRNEFKRVENKLYEIGYNPVNPFSLTDKDTYFHILELELEQATTEKEKQDAERLIWEYCMRLDVKYLVSCHLVVVLKNWETSKGANLEICIAQKLGIPVLLEETLEPINYSFDITKTKNG